MRRLSKTLSLLISGLLLSGCFPSNILAPEQRLAALGTDSYVWASAQEAQILGLHTSTDIEGPLARVLQRITYLFEPDGTYTAAALFYGPPANFKVLSGTWEFADGSLRLDDAAPAVLDATEGFLRIRGDEGSVVLRVQ